VIPTESSFSAESLYLRSPKYLSDADIEVKLKTKVKEVDSERKRVYFEDKTHLKFEKLCIATGSKPRKPDIEGINTKNVCFLRTLDDLKLI
jgi:NAD(P)H-nitrite reductase large subunit